MTVAIISDIHGNYNALLAIAAEIQKRKIKNIICLGDICGYYSEVNECMELIKNITDKIVIGNHDSYIINDTQCPRSNSANKCLEYQKKVLKKENIEWLKCFPTNAVYYGINCVHGGWTNNLDEYIKEDNLHTIPIKEDFAVSGHSHIPMIKKIGNILYCNPGSVGQPRDGDYRASFAILNDNVFEIIRVDYNYKLTQMQMESAGFNEYFYVNLAYGLPIGARNVSLAKEL